MGAVKKKPARAAGERREGAGRKPIAEVAAMETINIRSTPDHKAKFLALGGAEWFRKALARAKAPKGV